MCKGIPVVVLLQTFKRHVASKSKLFVCAYEWLYVGSGNIRRDTCAGMHAQGYFGSFQAPVYMSVVLLCCSKTPDKITGETLAQAPSASVWI
jgi:hypothetical protein